MNYAEDMSFSVESSAMQEHEGTMEDEETEESRELTHEEIWDDSALIDAWNSANAEYEVCGVSSLSLMLADLLTLRHTMEKIRIGNKNP